MPFARRALTMTALEPDPAMASIAQRNCAGWDVSVEITSFEDWAAPPGPGFKLVMAAQSWHWVQPAVRLPKAHDLLVDDGVARAVLEPSRLARDRAATRDRRGVRTGRAGARRADAGQVAAGRRSSCVRRRADASPTSSARSPRPSTPGRRRTDGTRTWSCSTRSRIIGSSIRRRASDCSPKSDARSTTPAARSRSRTSPELYVARRAG